MPTPKPPEIKLMDVAIYNAKALHLDLDTAETAFTWGTNEKAEMYMSRAHRSLERVASALGYDLTKKGIKPDDQ